MGMCFGLWLLPGQGLGLPLSRRSSEEVGRAGPGNQPGACTGHLESPHRTSRASMGKTPAIPEADLSGGGLASQAPLARFVAPSVWWRHVVSKHLSALAARSLRPGGSPARPTGAGGAGVCCAAGGATGRPEERACQRLQRRDPAPTLGDCAATNTGTSGPYQRHRN